MPNQETVLKRSYVAIWISVAVIIATLFSLHAFSSSTVIQKEESKAMVCLAPIYYPSEDPSLDVFLDESLINKVASEPVQKTEEENFDEYIEYVCDSYPNVYPDLIRSVIMSESSFNPRARNGSHVGLMQVSTRWHSDRAKRLGVEDLYDPYGNVLVGIDYLNELIDQTKGDVVWALMIYNMGYKKAYELHKEGITSSYASGILSRI